MRFLLYEYLLNWKCVRIKKVNMRNFEYES